MSGIQTATIMVGKALFAKSAPLYQHALTTAEVARRIVAESGYCFGLRPAEAYCAGLIHDAGKLFIPDGILGKCDSLEEIEWDLMRRHPLWGLQFVRHTPLEKFREAVAFHHERVDGRGYPYGLQGDGFPPVGRLIQVADQVAAQFDDRSYRRRVGHAGFILGEIRPTVEELFPRHANGICAAVKTFLEGQDEQVPPVNTLRFSREAAV